MKLSKYLKIYFALMVVVLTILLPAIFVSSQDYTNGVTAIDWNSDATRIAVARYDRTLEVIDTSNNAQILSYGPLDLGIRSIVWSPTNRDKLAIAGGLGIVTILDLSATPLSAMFTDPVNIVDAIAWSPDGTKLVGAVRESHPPDQVTIHIWDGITGALIDKFQIYGEVLNQLSWSPDGKRVAGGSVDGTVVIWDASTNILLTSLATPEGFVDSLSWSPDSHQLVAASHYYGSPPQSNLGIWDVESDSLIANYPKALIKSVEWSPVGNQIAFTEGDTVQVIEAISGKILATFQSSDSVNALAWNSDGSQIAYGGRDGVISIAAVPKPTMPTPTENAHPG